MKKTLLAALCIVTVLACATMAQTSKKKPAPEYTPSRHHLKHVKKIARLGKGMHRASARSERSESRLHFRWIPTRGPKAKITPGAPTGGADRFRF